MLKVTFIEGNGAAREVEAKAGQSILDIAQANGIDMEGACEGAMACSTCHVIVEPDWYERLPEPSEDEDDMLDFASFLTATSRLACQIEVTPDMDGLVVRLPREVRNALLA